MPDFPEELRQIAQRMDDLTDRARDTGVLATLDKLRRAARDIGTAWSSSWFGYQANVYFRNFGKPSRDAYFSKKYGLTSRPQYGTVRRNEPRRTTGNWVEYDPEKVIETIISRAGNPNVNDMLDFYQRAEEEILKSRNDLLSILEIAYNESPSELLSNAKQEAIEISLVTEDELVERWAPVERTTDDHRAVRDGLMTPPHLWMLARVEAIAGSIQAAKATGNIARYTESHVARLQRRSRNIGSQGERVFIGHGRSPVWRKLKDFLQDRLGLATDEFNRVSTAGMPTSERLSNMLDTAGIAFLIMTAEDEQADGRVRARENVVHEIGYSQRALGFQRAIVLLEEDCEEFSNIIGLGQIRFPKGNVDAAFEDIRKVLEREGFIGAGQ